MGPELWREVKAGCGGEAGWVVLPQVFPSRFLESGSRFRQKVREFTALRASWSPRRTEVGDTGSSGWTFLGGMLRLT